MAEEKTNGEEIYGGADGALGRAEKSSKARREFIEKAMEPAEKAKKELIKDTATDEVRLQGTEETKAPKELRPYVEKVNVVDRKALGALIEKAKSEGRRWKVSKCVREGYRYTFTSSGAMPLNEKKAEPKLDVEGTPAEELPHEPEPSEEPAPTAAAEAEPERVLTAMDVVRSLVDISVTDDGRLSICAKPDGEPKDGEEPVCITTRPVTDEERAALGILPGDGAGVVSDEASSAEKVDEGIRGFFRKRKDDNPNPHIKSLWDREDIHFELTPDEVRAIADGVAAGETVLRSASRVDHKEWEEPMDVMGNGNRRTTIKATRVADEHHKMTPEELAELAKPGVKWEFGYDGGRMPYLSIGGEKFLIYGNLGRDPLKSLCDREKALRAEKFGKHPDDLDEASSAEKRAYRDGGEDAEDLIYGRTIGRIKNRLARNTLAGMYKNGGEDREAAKDALKGPAEKVASDFEGKEGKMQAKGYREEDGYDMDDIKSPIEPKPSRRCPKCGKADLNDAGECPLCDLGDESVLDDENESLISEGAKKPLGGDRFVKTVNSPIDSVDYLAELEKRGVKASTADDGVMVPADDYDFALDILMELEEAEYSHEGEDRNESCFGGECKSDKPLNEDSPVPSDVEVRLDDLDSFRPVAGARETWDAIAKAGKTKELAGVLADFAKDGKMTTTDLNDMLWFERDWVLSRLGINGIKPDDEIIDAEAEEI